LPQLEEVINKETELYEREHGRPFLIYGECFSDMISRQKEQHKKSQKLLKGARVGLIKQDVIRKRAYMVCPGIPVITYLLA
jgi:hypothetical protein